IELDRAPPVARGQSAPLARRGLLKRPCELLAVALDDVGMRAALEYMQPRVQVASLALVQQVHESTHCRFGAITRQHGLLEVITRRRVARRAVRLEPLPVALIF